MDRFRPEFLFIEGAEDDPGDIRELADFTIYVVDAFGDGIAPGTWPEVAESDLLVINKTRPGPPVDLAGNVVARESARLRGNAPLVLAHTRYGLGIIEIARHIQAHPHKSAVASCV